MGCIGCIAASFEKLSDIAAVHGINVESFVKELNEAVGIGTKFQYQSFKIIT